MVLTRNFSQSLILRQPINPFWVKEITPRRLLRLGNLRLNPKESTIHRVVMIFLRRPKIVKVSLYQRGLRLLRRFSKSKRRRKWKMISDPKILTKCLLSTPMMKMMTVEMMMPRLPTSNYLRSSARSNRAGNFPKENAVCFKTAKVLSSAASRSNRSSTKWRKWSRNLPVKTGNSKRR